MIKIYGCSDDLIELEGDVREEFYLPASEKAYVAFSDGSIVRLSYDGDWRVSVALLKEGASLTVTPWEQLGDDAYSDIAEFIPAEPIKWVVCGPGIFVKR